ncbi:MAG: NADH-quinone oxidoreductase subunit C [Rhodospirillaceae bacterium]|nr:NADH-quinone oxidoreductase subunit C [Rhodospirillaceae bacterium]
MQKEIFTDDNVLKDISELINLVLKTEIIETLIEKDCLIISIQPSSIVRVMKFLRDDSNCQFTQLIDLCGVDYLGQENRFEVVYHLLSMKQNARIRVKLCIEDNMSVPSVYTIFNSANWFEREVWDMYGIVFSDHPDLRRILTDYGFVGHPQRKDFPLSGYQEVRYDEEQKRVIYEPVKLTQDFRSFDFVSPWEGAEHAHQQVLPGDEKARSDG